MKLALTIFVLGASAAFAFVAPQPPKPQRMTELAAVDSQVANSLVWLVVAGAALASPILAEKGQLSFFSSATATKDTAENEAPTVPTDELTPKAEATPPEPEPVAIETPEPVEEAAIVVKEEPPKDAAPSTPAPAKEETSSEELTRLVKNVASTIETKREAERRMEERRAKKAADEKKIAEAYKEKVKQVSSEPRSAAKGETKQQKPKKRRFFRKAIKKVVAPWKKWESL